MRIGTARSMKALAAALLFLLFFGLLISVSVVGRGANAATVAVGGDSAAVMATPTSSDDRGTFNASMRRVPNGPDPIHNRRAGRLGRPPVRA